MVTKLHALALALAMVSTIAAAPPPTQSRAAEWVFVGSWPAHAGPGAVPREEVFVRLGGALEWRRITELQVDATARLTTAGEHGRALVSAASRERVRMRPRGSRTSEVDGPIGPFLHVAIGAGGRFQEWADETRLLPRPLVAAALELIAAGRRAPAAASPGPWVQALPLDPRLSSILQPQARAEAPGFPPSLARALHQPFAWLPLPSGPISVPGAPTLDTANAILVVDAGGRRMRVEFQHSSNQREP